jgi:putative membrane protein
MLKRKFYKWGIGVAAILIAVWLMGNLPEAMQLKWPSIWGAVVFVPVLAIINAILGTVVRFFALPINCMTLGLFGFVVNAVMFWIAGGLTHAQTGAGKPIGFLVSLIGSILYTFISAPLSILIKERK